MEIIRHTADAEKNEKTLEELFNGDAPIVELDFVITKDGVPIWTHDIYPTMLKKSDSEEFKDMMNLYDVLEINNHRKKLMLDIKLVSPKFLKSDKMYKLVRDLHQYDEMMIEGLEPHFVRKLIESGYSNLEIGLIVNVLSKHLAKGERNPKLDGLDFMALSSELWEKEDGAYVKNTMKEYPDVKKYAWTWSVRTEDEAKINNFLDKHADGIITGDPKMVRDVMDQRNMKR